ncbi:papilin isoform X1, partial [Brachionus plicatilis]
SEEDCRNSIFGCCPDGITPAEGQNYENCDLNEPDVSCHISEFGCCSDDLTPAKGPNQQGCTDQPCQNSLFGCCPDMKTVSKTEDKSDCPRDQASDFTYNLKSCSESEFECCPDGLTPANGPNFKDCAEDGSLILIKNQKLNLNICTLPQPENTCFDYSLKWRFSMTEGRCIQFWFGGCNSNENIFETNDECEDRCVSPKDIQVCELPPVSPTILVDTPDCLQNLTRFYYDASSASCKSFSYSGCYGNGNNFQSLEECDRKCQIPLLFEKCSFIPNKGPCRGDHERWYFDSRVGQCKTFSYGGCMITKNNHLSEDDCFNSCVRPKQKSVCLLPKIIGSCDEKIDSWYYDFNEGKCKEMLYSGCNGNLNRFETKEACEYTCQGLDDYPKQMITEDICHAPKISGSCHVKLQRWYYNSTTEMCQQFTYSGCDGSPNNFENEIDCRSTCNAKIIDPCELPMDSGTCTDYKLIWYYDKIEKECLRFYYGGCDGNLNRFDTQEKCEIDCKLSPEEKATFLKFPKKCLESIDEGTNCTELFPKWYFDIQTKMCYSFQYSGCGSEFSNRFDSNEECTETCVENLSPDDTTEIMASSTVDASTEIPIDVCNLPLEEGNCSQTISKWYYDTKLKYCLLFNFTGCYGNENKFENRQQCAEICEIPKKKEICYSNKALGPCDQFQIRWHYDPETQSCKDFHYGGCLGNDNNFFSLLECKNFCWDYLSEESRNQVYEEFSQPILTTTQVHSTSSIDICSLEKVEGDCDDQLVRWYYDPITKECLKFTYTGCNGNENNFESKGQCLSECSYGFLNTGLLDYDTPCEAVPDILPECIDPTNGEILSDKLVDYQDSVWFFDIVVQVCRPIKAECFNSQNSNRFDSLNECKSQCSPNMDDQKTEDDCLLPFENGNKCSLQIWKWYYDSKNGQCHLFSYSGCHGNNNNFPSYKDCMVLCAGVDSSCPSMDDCQLNCPYGRVITGNQCELCQCVNPCDGFYCDSLHQCVVEDSRPNCRLKNKPGICPEFLLSQTCENNCRTDADCDSNLKCCQSDCSNLQCTKPNLDKDPLIEEFKISVELNEGETLELPCKASGYPTPTITWYKGTQEIAFDSSDDRISLSEDSSLIIKNVSELDEAEYSCRASNLKGRDDIKQSKVVVNVFGEITHHSYYKHVMNGFDAVLFCNLTGRPFPKSHWYFNGSQDPIKPDPFKYAIYPHFIKIKRFNQNDAGIYTCKLDAKTIKNSAINVTLIEAVPGEVNFIFSKISGNEDSSVLLACEVKGEPMPLVTWNDPSFQPILFNSDKYEISNGSILKINSLKQKDHGIYRCYAHNEFSNSYLRKKFGSIFLNVDSQPVISSKSEVKIKNQSTNAIFDCIFNGSPKPYLNWFHENRLIILNSTVEEKHSSKYVYFYNGSLLIKDLKPKDSGTYSCQALNLDKFNPAVVNHTLKVIPNKLEVNHIYELNGMENEPIKLECRLEQVKDESCSIHWHFNETLLDLNNPKYETNKPIGSLNIESSQLSDSGLYTCLAETESVIYNTSVNVNINPALNKNTEIESKTKTVQALANQSTNLDCLWWFVDQNFDLTFDHIEWKLNSSPIEAKQNQKYEFLDNFKTILKIKNITVSDALDTYTCTLKLSPYIEKQSIFILEVGSIPYIENLKSKYASLWFYEFEQVKLECPFKGVPKPSVRWYFNSLLIDDDLTSFMINDNSLNILRLDEPLQGVYACNGSNIYGTTLVEFYVKIAKPIRLNEPEEKEVFGKSWDSINLKCEYTDADPRPAVTWFVNHTQIKGDSKKYQVESNNLVVRNLSPSDQGSYKCILSNGFFEDKSLLFHLTVFERVIIRVDPEDPVFESNKKGKLSCITENGIVTNFRWMKNNEYLVSGAKYSIDRNSLWINNLQSSDGGEYSCIAESHGVQVTKSVQVKVVRSQIRECEDRSSYNNCRLVVLKGWCARFSKYCCKTCKQAGFD